MVKIQFWNFDECGVIILLPLLPDPLSTGVVVLVRVRSIDQIDLFACSKGDCEDTFFTAYNLRP